MAKLMSYIKTLKRNTLTKQNSLFIRDEILMGKKAIIVK